jgi:deoxyribodipyrimidine photo-lyase
LKVTAVYANRDYEPAAIARDVEVKRALRRIAGTDFFEFKDQVIFERNEILTQGGTPFSVFTPYQRAWLKALQAAQVEPFPVEAYRHHLAPEPVLPLPGLAALGFPSAAPGYLPTGMQGAQQVFHDFIDRIDDYAAARDYPALNGTSGLSVHLRFGTLSIRQLVRFALHHGGRGAETWLGELIWRDFYQMILWHRPEVVTQCFKPGFEALV